MSPSRLRWPSRALVVGFVVAAVGACGDTGAPATPVPTTVTPSASTVTLDGIGSTSQLSVTVKDQTGANIPSASVTWASNATGVATVSSSGLVTAVAKGGAVITATSGSASGNITVTVTQNPAALQKVSGDAQSGTVAQQIANPIVVQVNDSKGNPVPDVSVSFAVTAGSGAVGNATVVTGGTGQASTTWTIGDTAGATNTATATVTGLTAVSFTATGTAAAAATLAKVSGDNQTTGAGLALANPIVVKVTDQFGNAVAGSTVVFTVTGGGGSVNPAAPASGVDGQAQTTWTVGGAGAQSLQAAVTGLTPVTFAATALTLSIASVTQDTLIEGQSITITGSGFSTTMTDDTVRIDGTLAAVTAASATQLTVTVPSYDCLPARDGGVHVSVGSVTSNTITKRIHPAAFVNLAVGAQEIQSTPGSFCLQFRPSASGGDGYVVGVGAAGELPSTQFPITISAGTGVSSAPAAGAPTALPSFRAGAGSAAPLTAPEVADQRSWARQYQGEARLREWEERNVFAPHRAGVLSAAPRGAMHAASLPSVGDTLRFTVADFSQANLCSGGTSVLTKVKAVGAAGIWATDVTNPGPDSLTDAEIQAYSDTFDTKIYAGDTTNFGAPSDLDGNQRVFIVMTLAVNKEAGGGIAGFVFSGDLLSKASCPVSNVGELFYGNVPDPGNAAGTGARSHAAISNQLPSLIAHEFTHDIQNGRRLLQAGGTNMAAWEAEGQAMLAQEVVGHLVLGNSAGNNYNFTAMNTGQAPRWYRQGFDLLGAYLGFKYTTSGKNANAPEQCSLYASTSTANIACFNFAFYGASWAFQRYLVDRFGASYPGGASKLTRDAIDKNVNLSGRANWQALLGVTAAGFDSLFAQWGGMLYADDRVGAASAEQKMSSWNLFDILNNLGSDYQLALTSRTFTAFSDARTVNGGGTAYTALSSGGAHPALAVKVRDGSGNALGASMRAQLWITRVQ